MQPMKHRSARAGLAALLAVIAWQGPSARAEAIPKFETYDEAVAWYLKLEMETMTPESTAIYMAKYYKPHGVLIVYFHKDREKGYIHGGFGESDWLDFKNAPSKGRHYNAFIKGRFRYYLKNEEPPPGG